MLNQVLQGDCLELMRDIPDKSVDMILCDLPYGTTACKWDVIIPFEPLWEQYKRIIKPNAAIVLTASQPFTSQLVMSNPKWFKYEWIWKKNLVSNPFCAKKQPLRAHENILVFYKKAPVYNPCFRDYAETTQERYKNGGMPKSGEKALHSVYRAIGGKRNELDMKRGSYPISIVDVKCVNNANFARLHPTQKPVALFEYLIKTYTNEGDLVLDNCAGSGTTGVAALNTGRNYILMEKELDYFNLINNRLADAIAQRQPTLEERVQWLETQVQAQSVKIKRLECHHQLSLFG